jgi:hypothetical protein
LPVAQRPEQRGGVVEAVMPPVQSGIMPDLHGLGAREALRTLTRIGATARMSGQGVVVEQTPAAGEPLAGGEVGYLKLDRRTSLPAAAGGGGTR